MVAYCRVDSLYALAKDYAVNGASIYLVFLGSVCWAVAMGGGRPFSSLDELLSMAVLTASW